MPEIKIYDLTEKDEYLILASDGLWDLASDKEVDHIVSKQQCKQRIAEKVFDFCIEKAAKESKISKENLLQMHPGPDKRDIIDDITIMIVDLKNQGKSIIK